MGSPLAPPIPPKIINRLFSPPLFPIIDSAESRLFSGHVALLPKVGSSHDVQSLIHVTVVGVKCRVCTSLVRLLIEPAASGLRLVCSPPKTEYVTILPSSVNERALLRSRCLVSMPARVFVFFGTLAYLSG